MYFIKGVEIISQKIYPLILTPLSLRPTKLDLKVGEVGPGGIILDPRGNIVDSFAWGLGKNPTTK